MLTTGGAIEMNLGTDGAKSSFILNSSGSIVETIKGKDVNGNSYRFICEGTSSETYKGGRSIDVLGTHYENVSIESIT